jgi:hypothetical protein
MRLPALAQIMLYAVGVSSAMALAWYEPLREAEGQS